MSLADGLKLVVDALGALLVPVVLFLLGQWFLRSKERSDNARQDAIQLAAFLEHLSSENKDRRKLALLALTYMNDAGVFPGILLQSVQSIAARDEPDVAAVARLALGAAHPREGLSQKDRDLLLEVLLPAKVHFERSHQAFQRWVDERPAKPNLEIEDAIKASNSVISALLRTKWHLIPGNLQVDALRLLEHYDAWLAEYYRLRPGGVRDPKVPYVFVGPLGFPFPVDAERRFVEQYAALVADDSGARTGILQTR
jgi:hypothetical protein